VADLRNQEFRLSEYFHREWQRCFSSSFHLEETMGLRVTKEEEIDG
jgi:hypothetical protein